MFRVTPVTGVLGSVDTPVTAGIQPQHVILDTAGQFAFVANAGSADLSGYLINPNGTLSSLGPAVNVGTLPKSPTFDPLNRFLFVPNSGSDNLSVFTFNTSTGGLTVVAGSPFGTGDNPQSASIDLQGRFVWVNNVTAGTVSMFFINAGGVLSAAAGSPLVTGLSPQRVVFRQFGLKLFAFVANAGGGTVSVYEVNQTNGGVISSPLGSPFLAGTTPSEVTIDPSGQFALVANTGSSDVSVFVINSTTGALVPVQNPGPPSSNFFPSGTAPQAVTIHPSGNFAYIANATSGDVSAYTIDQTTGVLSQIAGSPFPTGGTNPKRVIIDSGGKFAFVSNQNSDTIAVFSIDQTTGALSAVIGSPFPTGDAPDQATTAGTF
jgi:6-phosphogluconolactonase